jgi:hypothetical protein
MNAAGPSGRPSCLPCGGAGAELHLVAQGAVSSNYDVTQIKVRWGDLGSPTETGTYQGAMVEVALGDIRLAKCNPNTVFTAIHLDFLSDETSYLLTGVELSDRK